MSILTDKSGLPQLRCRTTASGYVYEVRIYSGWEACNHSFAAWVVGIAGLLAAQDKAATRD